MLGQMMATPLELNLLRRRAERLFRGRRVVTDTADGSVDVPLGDVLDRASRLAHALRGLGVRPGDRVGTLAWNTQQHLEAYLAVPCMGAVLHTLNLRLAPAQIAWIAEDAGDRVILADASLAPLVDAMRPHLRSVERIVIVPDEYEQLLAAAPAEPFAWPEIDEQSAAAMCFTSGTTGDPKGVVYSHRSMVLHTFHLAFADTAAVSQDDRVLPVVPMFHVNAWGFVYAAVGCGADLVLPGPRLQAAPLADLIERERVTLAAGVPTIWLGLVEELRERPRRLDALRLVACGGSAVPEALMRGFDEVKAGVLVHAWGMTETSPIGSFAKAGAADAASSPDELLRYRLSQGRPVLGVELRLWSLDDDAEAAWDGESMGEIQVRGPWVARSYWGDRDPERFADGWFRTGDIAVGRPDGSVQIVDRTKDVIKSGGEWISSVELENVILSHPAVRTAAIVGRPDERWSERPVAFVALRPGATLELDELRTWLDGRVARFWLPDDLVVLDELPLTGVGKLDKKVMRARYLEQRAERAG